MSLPTAATLPRRPAWVRLAWAALWLGLAAPALWQIIQLGHAVGGRFGYPYDLEWMEGGLLQHAQRISDGQGIYVQPSIDFIPYLYTPLYPRMIAVLGDAFGISYQLGRAISILSMLGIAILVFRSIASLRPVDARAGALAGGAVSERSRAAAMAGGVGAGPRVVGAVLAFGVFAACYPYVEGWYDLVRADTLFLFMITAGVLACARWARAGIGGNGDAMMMGCAAILALAFFAKQTGVLYAAWGGVLIAVAWIPELVRRADRGAVMRAVVRRLAVYALTAAVIGLGGTMMLDRVTHGWFWVYIFKIHQVHDFHMPRFWESFGHILWHFPALTVAIAVTVVAVIVTAIARPVRGRRLPDGAGAFLLWTSTYAVSTVVGAIGYGTEFAHFNAFMPALLHGALAVGAAVPALAGCARAWSGDRRATPYVVAAAAAAVALTGAITLARADWDPRRFIPRDADERAGAALVQHIASMDGDVWVPSHPWYAHLAGKRMFAHRMGIKDVTARKPRPVLGLDTALRTHAFSAIVCDNRDVHLDLPGFTTQYRTDAALPSGERPRLYTGARVVPEAVWIPAVKEKPPFGVRILADFESGNFAGWQARGTAWGKTPATGAVTGQAVVGGFGGRYFATSMRGGEAATGALTSEPFLLDGHKISLRLGGGTSDKLRVELRVDGKTVRTAKAQAPVGERLIETTWDIGEFFEQTAVLVLVDDDDGRSWAHLNVDEIWLWP
jgi:hypothetical protein